MARKATTERRMATAAKRAALGAAVVAAWAAWASAEVPRPEYPRPQFERAEWVNLNGDDWTFEFDFGESGRDAGRELFKSKGFSRKIVVPFCPESKLSGVGHTDFIPAMWYHRRVAVPAAWEGKRVLLNFGGVDYECEVYVDGKSAGFHFGGGASFSVDLTRRVRPGATHDLVVRVRDRQRGSGQPAGKQSGSYKSAGCYYTRTTGIWQTVWMEAVDRAGLKSCRIVPDLDGGRLVFVPAFASDAAETFEVTVRTADGSPAGGARAHAASGVPVSVPLASVRPWSPEDPHLYDVAYTVRDKSGRVVDSVKSYAGLRKVSVDGGWVLLNNRRRYLRFVLDQGFYPDGIWTAPTDAALKRDIELSMAAGFNGARLHQKVFEERFHYWADRLGYLTWGESASLGCDPDVERDARNFIAEWREVVERDANHPSIIAWTPFNETWPHRDAVQFRRTQDDVYLLTKALDPTRPVNDASGYTHTMTDLWTVHDYARGKELRALDAPDGEAWVMDPSWLKNLRKAWNGADPPGYDGQPYMVDEFGGLAWVPPERRHADNTWGYGSEIRTEEEFFSILEEQVRELTRIRRITGFCYTQLTDVEQEQNGVYFYDRTPKFDVGRFRRVFTMKAANEE